MQELGRIIDQMEQRGIISGYEGSKPRQLLITKEQWQEIKMASREVASNKDNNNTETNEENDEE